MMLIELPLPVAAKVELEANPTPEAPVPVIEDVAVTDPAVVKAAVTMIPSPPPEPPEQLEKTTGPLPVKGDWRLTPLLPAASPPVQVEKVTVPVVPGAQDASTATPAPAVGAVLAPEPESVIDPEVLVTTPATLPWMTTPLPPLPVPREAPIKKMVPFPTVVEMQPAPPTTLSPRTTELLAPLVPFRVMLPPPFVLMVDPDAKLIPVTPPLVPEEEATMSIELPLPVAAKFALEANPTPPLPAPVIEDVAVIDPAVVKAAPTLIPFPPVLLLLPATQLEKTTGPLPVKAPEKSTP